MKRYFISFVLIVSVVFLVMACFSLFSLFSACKMGNNDEELRKKEKEHQQKINDILNPTSDVPAYEGFKNVVYKSILKNKKGTPALYIHFGDKAICEIDQAETPQHCKMYAEYKIDNGIILLDFSKQIEIRKNITLQDIKDAYILVIKGYINAGLEELKKPNISEDKKKEIEKEIADAKIAIEDLKTNKRDEEFKPDVERIRNHAKKLTTINPIRVTISSDKKSLILEKYIDYDSVEYENMEFVTH